MHNISRIFLLSLVISTSGFSTQGHARHDIELREHTENIELYHSEGVSDSFFIHTLGDWAYTLASKALGYAGDAGKKLYQLVGPKAVSSAFEKLQDKGFENFTSAAVGNILSSLGGELARNLVITSQETARALAKNATGYPLVDGIIETVVAEVTPYLIEEHIINPLSKIAKDELKDTIRHLIWAYVYVKSGLDGDLASKISGITPKNT